MAKELINIISGQALEEKPQLTLAQLSQYCALSAEKLIEFIEHGVIEPYGTEAHGWRFSSISITRVQRACRLQRDLGVNTAGVALALDLIDELEQLRARIRRFES